jgi:hypothetical protein
VPVQPYNPEASAAFQDLVALGNVISGNLHRYDAGGYASYPWTFTSVERGRGYWLWLTTASADTVVRVSGQTAAGAVSLAVPQGWNLIGHPFEADVALAGVQVRSGATTKAFDGAVASGWIAGTVYYWEPNNGYRAAKSAGFGHGTLLRPWRGYWVKALVAGLELIVPKP